jgi:anti-anti-sigma regulatory factor
MDFKIDTKDFFTTIMPLKVEKRANLAGELREQLEKMRQTGSKNFIINLQECNELPEDIAGGFLNLHEEVYAMEHSLVFTGISKEGIAILKENETDLLINLAPSMAEAVDIISMEILERDLLGEE